MHPVRQISPSPLLSQAIEATLKGARTARAIQQAGLAPRQKSGDKDDLVTEGDEAAQKAILDLLPHARDGKTIGILAEEKIIGQPKADDARWRWVIDPIDGTLPYSKGDHFWCVSVALQERAAQWESRIGIVYQASPDDTGDALRGNLFFAESGGGTSIRSLADGGTRLLTRPSSIAPAAEFCAQGEFAAWARQAFEARHIATGFRRSICHAACEMLLGEKCAVVQDAGPLEWDIAAIALIAREAGALAYVPRIDSSPVADRYAALFAWDTALYEEFRAMLARSIE